MFTAISYLIFYSNIFTSIGSDFNNSAKLKDKDIVHVAPPLRSTIEQEDSEHTAITSPNIANSNASPVAMTEEERSHMKKYANLFVDKGWRAVQESWRTGDIRLNALPANTQIRFVEIAAGFGSRDDLKELMAAGVYFPPHIVDRLADAAMRSFDPDEDNQVNEKEIIEKYELLVTNGYYDEGSASRLYIKAASQSLYDVIKYLHKQGVRPTSNERLWDYSSNLIKRTNINQQMIDFLINAGYPPSERYISLRAKSIPDT